ncbi:hypothetical protein G9C98_000711 [Cotesia typhae]|uniref:Uncharacterized protein n=1 Tax=Cotesia typhae TaxID=2053667 RepID=A0A8J5V0H1_9HYME|nr:hypothetical protein G9C98_000711 [Cotesia typhae]
MRRVTTYRSITAEVKVDTSAHNSAQEEPSSAVYGTRFVNRVQVALIIQLMDQALLIWIEAIAVGIDTVTSRQTMMDSHPVR